MQIRKAIVICLLALASVTACDVAIAQQEGDALQDLQMRMEQQEQEIRHLRSLYEQSLQAPQYPVVGQEAAFSRLPVAYEHHAARLEALEAELQKEAAEKKASEEQKPVVKPRMRLHTDAAWFDQSAANRAAVDDIQDGTYFRRARIGFDAKAFEVTEYRLDFEMSSGGGRPSIFDAYVRVIELPILQNVQVGHFREPFSLEAQTSSNWFTFIERAPITVFDPSRNWGMMTFGTTEMQNATWAVGVFREGSDNFGDDIGDSGERAVTGRLTWLPYYDEPSDGRYFFHVGASGSYRDPDNANQGGAETSIFGYAARPEVNIREDGVGGVPAFADTGNMPDVQDVQLAGVESALIWGAWSIQGEYIGSFVDRTANPDPWFHGAYVQASYFLTGENRAYNRRTGTFDRTDVFEPFFRVRTADGICMGKGAWEVAMRWSYIDLNDGGVGGGYFDDTNVGVNWYLNPYVRVMFNYIYADLHDPALGRSDANIFLTRMSMFF